MTHTVASLKEKGYKGIQRNTFTGNIVEANYVLDKIAWVANNAPQRLRFENDDVRGRVYVRIINEHWTPYTNLDCYAERNMTKDELIEADTRLAEIGMKVNRQAE